jgi:hypothetical protein
MNFVEAAEAIKGTLKRVTMLKKMALTPGDAREQLTREVEALEIALSCLEDKSAHILVAIGHNSIIESALKKLEDLKQLDRVTKDLVPDEADVQCLVILEPSQEIVEACLSIFNPDNWQSNNLSPDHTLDWIQRCNQYYAAVKGEEKSLLFDLDVQKDFLTKTDELRKWASAIFNNVVWSTFKPKPE